jgi:hypothetical protein
MAKRKRDVLTEANERARAALAATPVTAGSNLGALAWWDVEASSWSMQSPDARRACSAHGLDPDSTLPAPPDWPSAFGRAVESVRATASAAGFMVADAAAGPNGERRVAIARVRRNGIVELDAHQSLVSCPKDGRPPVIERDAGEGLAERIVDTTRTHFDTYTGQDMRTCIVGMFERWACLPCRRHPPKIVYWVPPGAVDTIARVADFARSVGWGDVSMFAGSPGDPRTQNAVQATVNAGLEDKLAELGARIDAYVADGKTRASTLERALTDAQALRDQWNLYRTILGAAVQNGDERIAKLEAAARARLASGASAHP